MKRRLLLVVVSLAIAAPAAAAPLFVIEGDKKVAGLSIGHALPAAARARFGTPSAVHPNLPQACSIRWSGIGVSLVFLDLSTGKPCKQGVLVTATITSRAAWRTVKGLRVGDSVARLRMLYPAATLHTGVPGQNGWWLITRHACAEVGGQAFPGLLARVNAGRVSAIVAGTTACE
jgi:hypothetical protein